MRILLGLVAVAAVAFSFLLLTKPVWVVQPSANPSIPVRSITVQFSRVFVAGSFHADLDGADVTQSFGPAPARGARSTMVIADPFGFSGGTAVATGVDTNAPISLGPRTVFQHELAMTGDCLGGGLFCGTLQRWPFRPVQLFAIFPAPGQITPWAQPKLKVRDFAFLSVGAWGASVPVEVIVRPSSDAVSLDGAPPGTMVQRRISPGEIISVSVTGIRPSNAVDLAVSSPGTQRSSAFIQIE